MATSPLPHQLQPVPDLGERQYRLQLAIIAAQVLVIMSVCAVAIVYIIRQPAWAAAAGIISALAGLVGAWRSRAGPTT